MDGDGADRFGAFVNALAEVVGHADRVRPLTLHGTPHPGGAQERRAARGGDPRPAPSSLFATILAAPPR